MVPIYFCLHASQDPGGVFRATNANSETPEVGDSATGKRAPSVQLPGSQDWTSGTRDPGLLAEEIMEF